MRWVQSPNVLLNDTYTAKLSDVGKDARGIEPQILICKLKPLEAMHIPKKVVVVVAYLNCNCNRNPVYDILCIHVMLQADWASLSTTKGS